MNQLVEALELGRFEEAEKLLARHPGLAKSPLSDGQSILLIAIENCPAAVETLIDSGAPVNPADQISGETPLIAAIGESRSDLVALLLGNGADPMLANAHRVTPVEYTFSRLDLDEEAEPELVRILNLLKDAGGRPIDARDFESCPDGTQLTNVEVIPDYVDLTEAQRQAVAAGDLLAVREGDYLSEHPFSKTSRWHFCPVKKTWDRVSDGLVGYKRPFPDLIAGFRIPTDMEHTASYRQTLRDGEVVKFEFELSPTGTVASNLQELTRANLKEQGVIILDDFLEATDAVVELDDGWELRVSVFGEASSTNTMLWMTVTREAEFEI